MTKLKAKTRDEKLKAKKIRRDKMIPAVIYGQGKKARHIALKYLDFEKLYDQIGESSLVDLDIDGKNEIKALIHDVQTDPISGKYIHADFYEVDLTKKVTVAVELEFTGEAPIVKNEGGILIKHLNEIEIECLPTDLVKKFKVDVSGLTDFNSAIHVKDLKISDKVEILNDPDEVVINVSEPKEEEEKPAPAEGEEAVKGEGEAVAEKQKEGDTEGAEKAESAESSKKAEEAEKK